MLISYKGSIIIILKMVIFFSWLTREITDTCFIDFWMRYLDIKQNNSRGTDHFKMYVQLFQFPVSFK